MKKQNSSLLQQTLGEYPNKIKNKVAAGLKITDGNENFREVMKMAKYKIEVGSFVTRLVTRHITVNAKNEEEARSKAIDKYIALETKVESSVDFGSPQVDFISEAN